jgi:hypothetical protein
LLIRILEVLAVAWLPGAVIFRLPWFERDRRASLAAEERGFWAIVLSVAYSLSVVLALAAAHRYSFTRLLIADAACAIGLALAARFDLRLGAKSRRPGMTALIPIALVAIACVRFFPSSEYVIGGKDPGVYLNAGVQIAQRGAIVAHDPVVAAVPPASRALFFPQDRRHGYYLSLRFMGFFILDPDTGAVVSQFQHLFSASVAVGYGVNGVNGARWTPGVWAILGVLAVYFAGARLIGVPAAAAAATLLALNVVQVWFGRYPNIEISMQALLFAALLANARAHVDDDPFFAPVAAILLVLALFARWDAAIAVVAVVAALALGVVANQRRVRWTFVLTLAAGSALCAWYLLAVMKAYVELPLLFIYNLPAAGHIALVVIPIAGIVLVAAASRSKTLSRWTRDGFPTALAIAVTALAAYAFFFRHAGGRLADYDAGALRTFADFYFSVPALGAAVIGYWIVARGLFWRDPALVLTVTAFAVVFFFKIRIVPEHFWAARRFVPAILPGALLFAAAAALTGIRGRSWLTRSIRGPIGVVFVALLAVHYARVAAPVVHHIEYEGIMARLETLAGRIGDRDLLIVESRDSGSDDHVFALPLADIYARNVLVLANAAPDKQALGAFLDAARARYQRVLFLGEGGTDLLSPRWSLTPVASDRFEVPEYDSPWNAFPKFVRHKKFSYTVYAFGNPAAASSTSASIDIGTNDDANVLRFYAKEETEGRSFRWSARQSIVIVDHLAPADRTLALWMSSGGRPPAATPADVTIVIGDRTLGTIDVANGFKEYDVAIPPEVAAANATGQPVRILLRTPTWNPLKVLGTADDRDLGVMVDRVAVR